MAVPAVLPKLLAYFGPAVDGKLTLAGDTLYSTPVNTTVARILLLRFTNTDASPHTWTLWSHSINGGPSMTDAHVLYKDVPLAANTTVLVAVPFVCGSPLGGASTGHLMAAADADSVIEFAIFGAEIDTIDPNVGRSLPYESFQGVLTTTPGAAILFAVLASTTSEVALSLILCNVDSSPHDVTIQFNADVFSGFHETRVITVPANDTVVVQDQIILSGAGIGNEYLTAFASANGFITATMSTIRVLLAP